MMQKLHNFWFAGRPPHVFVAFLGLLLICGILKWRFENQAWPYMIEAVTMFIVAIPTIILAWWKESHP